MSAVAKKPLTAEEFWQMPEHRDYELIDGEIVQTMPTNGEHSEVVTELLTRLRVWSKETKAGRVGTEAGFLLAREPDRLRGPDIFFIKAERNVTVPKQFYETFPDLAVEVISNSDTTKVVKEKLEDYFAAGTGLVWLVYPDFKQVEAHTPDGISKIFRENDTLQAEVLPGFACKVGELLEF